jgi:hypothetical protein
MIGENPPSNGIPGENSNSTCGEESYACAIIAAPIDEATPLSAWQPPSAASVALCLQR